MSISIKVSNTFSKPNGSHYKKLENPQLTNNPFNDGVRSLNLSDSNQQKLNDSQNFITESVLLSFTLIELVKKLKIDEKNDFSNLTKQKIIKNLQCLGSNFYEIFLGNKHYIDINSKNLTKTKINYVNKKGAKTSFKFTSRDVLKYKILTDKLSKSFSQIENFLKHLQDGKQITRLNDNLVIKLDSIKTCSLEISNNYELYYFVTLIQF